jgi:predicted nucleic acid-binding protein
VSVIDASVWVSLLLVDDANHEQTIKWIEAQAMEGVRLVAPVLALVEVAAAITRRAGIASAEAALARLRSTPGLVLIDLNRERAERAAVLAARLAVKGADAVYAALAVELEDVLVTWDREQRERSSPVVRTVSPADDRLGR